MEAELGAPLGVTWLRLFALVQRRRPAERALPSPGPLPPTSIATFFSASGVVDKQGSSPATPK